MGSKAERRHIDTGFTSIAESKRELQGVMGKLYRDLNTHLRQKPGELPRWLVKKGRGCIIIDPGSPVKPALALKPDGSLVYTQWNISSNPRPKNPLLDGTTYIQTAEKTLILLRAEVEKQNNKQQKPEERQLTPPR